MTYGEWPSPISAQLVAASSGGASWPSIVDSEVWWCASDPRTARVFDPAIRGHTDQFILKFRKGAERRDERERSERQDDRAAHLDHTDG